MYSTIYNILVYIILLIIIILILLDIVLKVKLHDQLQKISVSMSLNRKRLFSLINDQPTVFEVVTQRKAIKDKVGADTGIKSRMSTKVIFSLKFYWVSFATSCELYTCKKF